MKSKSLRLVLISSYCIIAVFFYTPFAHAASPSGNGIVASIGSLMDMLGDLLWIKTGIVSLDIKPTLAAVNTSFAQSSTEENNFATTTENQVKQDVYIDRIIYTNSTSTVSRSLFNSVVDNLQNQINNLSRGGARPIATMMDDASFQLIQKQISGLQNAIAYTGQPLSKITINNSGSITGSVGTFTGLSLTGDTTSTGNITAAYFYGDGSHLTGITSSGGSSAWSVGAGFIYNSTSTDLVGIGTTTPTSKLTVAGNVAATAFVGDGSQITGLNAANISSVSQETDDYGNFYLRNWQATIAGIRAGATTSASIAMIGDSWTAGTTISLPLTQDLQNVIGFAGEGWGGLGQSNFPQPSIGRATTGTWSQASTGSFDGTGLTSTDTATPATGTLSCSNANRMVVYFERKSGGGSFSYAFDGGGSTSTSTSAGSTSVATIDSGTLTAGSHSIVMTVTAAGSTGVTIYGVDCQYNNSGGVRIGEMGQSGAQAATFNALSSTWDSSFAIMQPTVAIILLGVNDRNVGVATSTYVASIGSLVSRIRAASPATDVVLVSQTDSGLGSVPLPLSDYALALRDYARQNGVAFVDAYKDLGPFNNNLYGYYLPNYHPSATGGAAIAKIIESFLLKNLHSITGIGSNFLFRSNVAIGTSTPYSVPYIPAAKLQLLQGSANSTNQLMFTDLSTNESNSTEEILFNHGVGSIYGAGVDGGKILAGRDGVYGGAQSTQVSNMQFYTAQNGVNTEVFRINSNGRMGIGTTTPADKLDVNGAIYLDTISAPGVTTNRLYNVGGNLTWNGTTLGAAGTNPWTTLGNNIYYNTGNIGIGTTTPQYKLETLDTSGGVDSGIAIGNNVLNSSSQTLSLYFNQGAVTGYGGAGGKIVSGRDHVYGGAPSTQVSNMQFYTAQNGVNTEVFRINSNGRMGIGTTTPLNYKLTVAGTVAFTGLTSSATGNAVCINATTGEIQNSGAGTCTVSSERFKHDIQNINEGLNFVNQLRPVSFSINDTNQPSVGFIAEEVNKLDPRLVFYDVGSTSTPRGVRYENMTAVLAKAIQELDTKVDNLASSTNFLSATSSPTIISLISSAISSISNFVVTKITATLGVFNRVETNQIQVNEGATMKDHTTGQYYCVYVDGGILKNVSGTCDSVFSPSQPSSQDTASSTNSDITLISGTSTTPDISSSTVEATSTISVSASSTVPTDSTTPDAASTTPSL